MRLVSATILSFAMMLRYSFDMDEDAAFIERAIERLLGSGVGTADLRIAGNRTVSTAELGKALLAQLDALAG